MAFGSSPALYPCAGCGKLLTWFKMTESRCPEHKSEETWQYCDNQWEKITLVWKRWCDYCDAVNCRKDYLNFTDEQKYLHGGASDFDEKPVKLRSLRLYKPDKPLTGQLVKLIPAESSPQNEKVCHHAQGIVNVVNHRCSRGKCVLSRRQ